MKKSYLILAAAALFAACSSDSNDSAEKQTAKNEPMAISFDSYVNRGTTRAGAVGTITNSDGTGTNKLLQATGFGVFGYYTDNQYYSELAKPNFMYNQLVSGPSWNYSPIKYWPNEFGSTAESEGIDRLSFFAYAPYVEVTPETGIVTDGSKTGIVALTSNTKSGDPYVKYFVDTDPAKRVDLCWGVAATAYNTTVDGTAEPTVATGYPFIDLTKPQVGKKINFNFKHALASLNVQIDADVDKATVDETTPVAAKTKIYVRSISFEGFATQGMLNLNSSTVDWYDLTGINKIGSSTFTVFDGRRDGKEGQANATATNEIPSGINENIIQNSTTTTGVTNTTVNLFNNSTLTEPIFVIPTATPLSVTIVYDVETEDDHLSGFLSDGKTHGSTIENKITKDIKWTGSTTALEAGKKYTVKLHLGMTSVKFEAEVTEWTDGDTGNGELPYNK